MLEMCGVGVAQRYKKWWNRGTRFTESKLTCRKFLVLRREIAETITADLSAEHSEVIEEKK
jgi:hypothetical protein